MTGGVTKGGADIGPEGTGAFAAVVDDRIFARGLLRVGRQQSKFSSFFAFLALFAVEIRICSVSVLLCLRIVASCGYFVRRGAEFFCPPFSS